VLLRARGGVNANLIGGVQESEGNRHFLGEERSEGGKGEGKVCETSQLALKVIGKE